ncbi:MAG TPA: serine/threonine-protein kinase, partial [Gemmata sp.]|nr:serine/threonine-protein kinase [Gemmata sp.]
MVLGSTIGEAAWADCESLIRRFEDAWREQARPEISSFVPRDSPHATQVLVELVHIDLEFRLRADEMARVEDYLSRFPELSVPEFTLDLVSAEFALRNRLSPPAWPEEYWLRFPEHLPELQSRLRLDGGTGWFAATRPVERPGTPLAHPPSIAGYEILGELGRGGMGVVYKARDLLLHRTVAVKTFATVPRPDSCARFAREAEAIARLDHPNIVPVYEVGEWRLADGAFAVPFFVMKWYPGGSMDAAPAGKGTDMAAQARSVETIARAVHHAHQRGVLHRDLKPSNILFDDSARPNVADFGLAGRVDPDVQTITAVVAGTPAYMAPEQARNPKEVSTAADVYGLGAILYHQLAGRAPFVAETPLATLELVANAEPPRPSSINPAVPRDLDTICLKCLAKDPARRYATAAEVADDLQRWQCGLPIAARPVGIWEVAWRRLRRHPVISAMAAITFAALASAVGVLAVSNNRIREKEKETFLAFERECTMREKLQQTLDREQRALYLDRVALAGRLYAANQLTQAWELLDLCPENHRGWEWRYLDALRRQNAIALAGHPTTILTMAFLPDGRLVSADAGGFVKTWDVESRKCQKTWRFASAAIRTLAVHPRRNWVAIADMDSVSVRDVDSGRTIARLNGANWAAFSPDGRHAVTADQTVLRLWAVPEGEMGTSGKKAGDDSPPAWTPIGELRGHTGMM